MQAWSAPSVPSRRFRARPTSSRDEVSFTLDIRAPTDAHRKLAVAEIVRRIEAIAKRRDLSLQIDVTHENRTVPCAPWLKTQVAEAVAAEGYGVFELPSGAGHDGMAMIDIADVAMLFVRCRGGISHNPAEHVEPADADAGARVLLRLIENFRPGGQHCVVGWVERSETHHPVMADATWPDHPRHPPQD